MLDVMYESPPATDVKRCVITEAVLEGRRSRPGYPG